MAAAVPTRRDVRHFKPLLLLSDGPALHRAVTVFAVFHGEQPRDVAAHSRREMQPSV